MHHFVQRIMRGVIFCTVTIVLTACAGSTDQGDRERARERAAAQSEKGLPRIDAIRLRVARNALENGDYNTAIRFFESVQKSSPSNVAPILGIARAHIAAGNHREAIIAFRQVLKLDSNHDEALDGIGRALVLTGNYRDAIEYFNRSLSSAPSADLHNRLGVAHDLMGDGIGAQKHYRAALALDPEAISARNNLALSLAISESYAEAIKQMERVAAHPQATDKHRQNLAFVYGMAGENDAAAAAFSESGLTASEIAKKRALYKRIRELAQAGKHAEILEYLRNGHDLGDPMVADKLSDPAGSSSDMASAMTDTDPAINGSSEKNKVVPPKPLFKGKELSNKTRVANIPKSVGRAPRKSGRARPVLTGPAHYRVQLGAYRTSRDAARGVKILHSLLKKGTPELEILVRKTINKEKRTINYRIRTPRIPDHGAASKLCTRIRKAGHPDCLVILHNSRVWASVDQPNLSPVTKVIKVSKGAKGVKAAKQEGAYRLQLASFRTERGATKGQAVLKKLLGDRAVDLDILVKRPKNDDPAAFNYQIRTSPVKTRAHGVGICEALKKAGHRGCLMVEHDDLLWRNLAMAGEHDKASLDSQTVPTPRDPEKDVVLSKGDRTADSTDRTPQDMKKDVVLSKGDQPADPAPLVTKAPTPSRNTVTTSYRLQLASYRSERSATKGHAKLKSLLGDRGVSLDILVKRKRSGGPAAYDYQIRTGPLKSLTEGVDLCETLKKAGHQGCLVVQHNDLLWKNLAKVRTAAQ